MLQNECGFIPQNLLLQWHITERCNLHCDHCYQDTISDLELDWISLVKILEQFKELLAFYRARQTVRAHITLTGGEPFVRKDFPKLVELIASQNTLFSFAILTNGMLIDFEHAAWLKSLGVAFVQVSLEGTQTTHDRIRGVGSFEQTVEAIRRLTTAKVPTYISFTAQRQNYREFCSVARLGRQLKVQRVWADRLIPAGRNHKILQKEILSPDETWEWLKIMAAARKEARRAWFNHTEIGLNRALQFWTGEGQPYHCSAGGNLICIMANGELVPCRRMPIVVGNLLRQPLTELYQCDQFRALRNPDHISRGCQKCLYANLCGGGLRCLAYALTGSPFEADPGCWQVNTVPAD